MAAITGTKKNTIIPTSVIGLFLESLCNSPRTLASGVSPFFLPPPLLMPPGAPQHHQPPTPPQTPKTPDPANSTGRVS